MGRERRADGPPATMPTGRFEVDLTSVCVQRGTVQLPYRLRGAFREGTVAAVDADGGAPLELAFKAPRELFGLRPFFEAHALRANDRIGLIFADDGLRVEAVRRERRPAGRVAEPNASAGAHPDASEAAASAPPGAPRERGAERRRDAVPAAPPAPERESGSRSAAPSVPPTLHMVVPTASVPADEVDAGPASLASERAPRWEPLDITAARSEVASALERARPKTDEPTSMVRAVRRSSTGEAEAPSVPDEGPEPGAPSAPPLRPTGASEAEDPPTGPVPGRGLDLFGLRRRLGIGRGRSRRPAVPGAAPGLEARGGEPSSQAVHATSGPVPEGPASDAPRGEHAVQVLMEQAGASEPVEDAPSDEDIGVVQAYLARPNTPAIVRAERVAEALGISVSRADRALGRISEDSEQLNRIRAQAYMVRRRG